MKNPVTCLFGIKINLLKFKNTIEIIHRTIQSRGRVFLLPMNIHILTEVSKNPEIQQYYDGNKNIVFADGVPLVLFSKLTKHKIPERISGTRLVDTILRSFKDSYLIGSDKITLRTLREKYNSINADAIVGYTSPPHKENWGNKTNTNIIHSINATGSKIVLVGVGPLKQEQWIFNYGLKTKANIFIAVGSAFDILAGKYPRAPVWAQTIGLEWIWRILLEPKRLTGRYAADIYEFIKLLFRTLITQVKRNKHVLWSLFGLCFLVILFGIVFLRIKQNSNTINYKYDPERSGNYQIPAKTTPKWWRFKSDGFLTCVPVVSESLLFVSGWEDYALYAINITSGKVQWKFKANADLPFAPTIYNNSVFIGSVDGHLYALEKNSGKIQWTFSTENLKSITTHPYIVDSTIFFGGRDGYLYSLNAFSGKENWRFKTNDKIESSPLLSEGVIYFGSFDGNLYAINYKTGKEVWRFHTDKPILSSPAISNNVIYFGSEDSAVYAINLKNRKLVWKTQTTGPIDGTPTISHNLVLIANLTNEIYAMNTATGTIEWRISVPTGAHAGFAIDETNTYFGSTDNTLYSLRLKDGSVVWKYTTNQPITAAPSIINDTIYITSGWYVYALNKHTGKPFVDINKTTILSAPSKTKLYEPIEFSLTHDDSLYQNPWNEASVSATFISPSNNTVLIDGFYYDHNEWRIRFTPDEIGEWRWNVSTRPTPSSERTFNGRFTVEESKRPGFIRIDKNNPFRFVFDDGRPFYPIGISDSLRDVNGDGYPFDDFGVDQKANVSLKEYAKIYGDAGAGFNMFRWSVDNSSFPLWGAFYNSLSEKSARWETYPIKNGLWGDELIGTLQKNGFHIWMTIYGFSPNSYKEISETILKQTSIESYIRYVVARYGSYVDVWELSNEAYPTVEWVNYVTKLIESVDPYHHPITVSHEMPYINGIDISAPHWYHIEPPGEADTSILTKINQYTQWKKPIVFGEEGNQYINWDKTSNLRMRVRLWTAFMNDASLIFWNTSITKEYKHPKNANIYLGPEERASVKTFKDTVKDIVSPYQNKIIINSNPEVRAYAIESTDEIIAYLFHYSNPLTQTSTYLDISYPKNAELIWINPTNGDIIKTDYFGSGWNRIQTPLFSEDLILKLKYIK
jgi:eukaryotic-like serine/threonine-protein kinase